MKSLTSSFGVGAEFDDFLFATIAEDRNGLPLSVVSLLGRMDLDPWQEAAVLAALPAEAAAQRLTSLLGRVPDSTLQQPDPGTTVARLVALLPRRPGPNTHPLQASTSDAATTRARTMWNRIFLASYLIVMLVSQFVVARFGPTRADAAHTPASVTAPSQTPPPASVK
jgi:hypothetical protein